jgi:hypothetical protein
MHGATPTVDALAAAVRLDLSMDAMRAAMVADAGEGRTAEQLAADVVTTVQLGTVEPPLTAQEFAAALDIDTRDDTDEEQEPITLPAPGAADTGKAAAAPPLPTVADHSPGRLAPAVTPPAFSSERSMSWRPRHDERSRRFGVRERLSGRAPLQDVMLPVGPVFDQGTGSTCFGMAAAAAVNCMRLAGQLAPAAPLLGMGEAVGLFHLAQLRDEIPGEDYPGTSVTGGMAALLESGLIGGYLWSFGTRDIADTLIARRRPVIVGVPWPSGMYETGPGGLVELSGDDEGLGHVLAVVGIARKGPQGQPGPFFGWQNSHGDDYGDHGIGWIHHRNLSALLRGRGEAAIPTPDAQTPAP